VQEKMPGELSSDERWTGKNRFKVETFIKVLDEVTQQLDSRFTTQNVAFMRQLAFFIPISLQSNDIVQISDINEVCLQYGVDPAAVVSELRDFTATYRSLCLDKGAAHDDEEIEDAKFIPASSDLIGEY
jgi:hypothetical protein